MASSEVGRQVTRDVGQGRVLPVGAAAGGADSVRGAGLSAHVIPRDVTVQAFVKPEGQTLRMLIRVPLKGIEDVESPAANRNMSTSRASIRRFGTRRRSSWSTISRLYEGDTLLPAPRIVATQFSLESDRSFENYDSALAHVTGPPLPADTTIFWEQGMLDVLFEYPIQSDRSHFSIDAQFDRLALTVITALRFLPPGGAERVYELEGNAGLVRLDPRWHQAVGRFVVLGFEHILDGTDHLLFLLLPRHPVPPASARSSRS